MSTTMKFTEKLHAAWESQNSLLMIGLDPDQQRFPEDIVQDKNAIYEFCIGIVDATAEY